MKKYSFVGGMKNRRDREMLTRMDDMFELTYGGVSRLSVLTTTGGGLA